MRRLALVLVLAFVLTTLGAALTAAPEVKKATGEVTFICKQHKAIKLKVDDKELVLLVNPNCPKKQELMKKIGGLEVGQKVTASYFQCPKSKKLYLTKIEEPPAET